MFRGIKAIIRLTCTAYNLKSMDEEGNEMMETARYMAELFTLPEGKKTITVLDAGAGSGILTCAVVERLELADDIEKI